MLSSNFNGDIQELADIARFCRLRGRWYYAQNHNTYALIAAGSELTWDATSGLVDGIAQTIDQTMHFHGVLAMAERQKARGERLVLPTPSRTVEILPLPTKHPLCHAYNSLVVYKSRPGTPKPLVPSGVSFTDAASTSEVDATARWMLAIVAKPETPAQKELCNRFSSHLARAEWASVEPKAFEQWLGRDSLNAWSRAARKLKMHSETGGALHYHNYLSNEENAEIAAYLARSALH